MKYCVKNCKFILDFILDCIKRIIAPPYCTYCRIFTQQDNVFCSSCIELIKPIVSTTINLYGANKMTVHAASDYSQPLRSLILAKGYSEYKASKQLAYIIWHYSALRNIDFDYLVPVPLHWTRYAWRGYNQSEVIAQELARLSGKKVLNILKRIRKTEFQASVQACERKTNVAQAFRLCQNIGYNNLNNKKFIIVDDLMTTGSTLEAVGKVLLLLKPELIHAVVACRVI